MPDILKSQYCVIGDPIGHSMSPQIHGTVFRHFQLGFDYVALRIPSENLSEFVSVAKSSGRPGFNVTIPHKQAIIPLLDEIDPVASRIGAVNTVVLNKGRLRGYNTDVQGCLFSLKKSAWSPSGQALLLGAGGAARAAIEALSMLDVKTVFVHDLQKDKLSDLTIHFRGLHPEMKIIALASDSPLPLDSFHGVSLLINATPVGMWPNTAAMPINPDFLPKSAVVFDMVPKPIGTQLLKRAKSLGLVTIPGIRMLIAQALESDALFLERTIPAALFDAIERELYAIQEEHAEP